MADLGTLMTSFGADLAPLKRSTLAAQSQFQKFQKGGLASLNSVKKAVFSLQGAMIGLGVAVGSVTIIKKLIKSASDLQEVQSKFDVVFAGQQQRAETWSKTLVDSYAMSTKEAKQYLSSVQDLLVPMGMMSEAAGKMSNEVVKLAADLGSFNNMPTAQVMMNIQSALTGEYESMKKYGIVINATVVQQRALEDGLASSKEELTAGMKAQAAYALMVEGSTAAIGDMARTMDGAANQGKQWKAHLEDITALLGQALIPYYQVMLKEINNWLNINKSMIAQNVPGFIGKVGSAFALVIETMRFFHNAWLGIKLVGQSAIQAIAISLDVLFTTLRKFLIPLDLVFEGLKKIGMLDINPLDKIEGVFADFRAVSGDVTKDILDDITKVNSAYDSAAGVIDKVQKKLKDTKVGGDTSLMLPVKETAQSSIPDNKAYTKLIEQLTFQKSLLGETETAQRAMNLAVQNGVTIGSAQYENILGMVTAYDTLKVSLDTAAETQEKYRMALEQFDSEYAEMGQSRFDLERLQIMKQSEFLIEAAQNDANKKVEIAEWTAKKLKDITRSENDAKLTMYQTTAGNIANTFQQIAQAGGKQSKAAFMAYKAFAMVEAGISAAKAISGALGSPPYGAGAIAMAASVGAMAAVQIAMIASSQPPSYDQGGVSRAKGVYQTGNIDEAHIPLKGGKVPVEMGKNGKADSTETASPVDVTILNAFDPGMIDEYMHSSQGQSAIINVIGNRSESVKRMLR